MFKTLDDVNLQGKTVLVRGDLNVPMKDGKVTDATRIERLLPTINDLKKQGARVVLLSHFGRPKGQIVPEMSLAQIQPALAEYTKCEVAFVDESIGAKANSAVAAMKDGDILLLENLRFHAEEEKNDPDFAKQLAELGDYFVNDAFSAAHRAHASTEGIAHILPALAGRNMQKELEALDSALGNPSHPVMAIVGGAKVSTKLAVLGHLVNKVDMLVIGGGMANTFLYAMGTDVGQSLCEKDLKATALEILGKAHEAGCEILLPVDAAVAEEFKANADMEIRPVTAIQDKGMMLDIGPDSITALSAKISTCKTLLWNGPLGAFEIEPFDKGTVAIAQHAGQLAEEGKLVAIAGGGDTVAAMAHAGVSEKMTYISTAGGAFLEWMEGKTLPGVAALTH